MHSKCKMPIDFNVTKYEIFIDRVSDLHCNLTLKKMTILWCSIKEYWIAIIILLPFPTIYLCETRFSTVFNQNGICNGKPIWESDFLSLKPSILRYICKIYKNNPVLTFFKFGKQLFFHKNIVIYNGYILVILK